MFCLLLPPKLFTDNVSAISKDVRCEISLDYIYPLVPPRRVSDATDDISLWLIDSSHQGAKTQIVRSLAVLHKAEIWLTVHHSCYFISEEHLGKWSWRNREMKKLGGIPDSRRSYILIFSCVALVENRW